MVNSSLLSGLRRFLGVDSDLEEEYRFFNADGSEALIGEVIYDPDNEALMVTYSNGRSYTYWEVSSQRFRRFREAASRGEYINFAIKPNYLYSRGAF